ncbi:hypothetical protein SCHPADRAFT_348676 [Schizopora paradoxa]|uniref:MYND-type domain-containing protein n=1 Tax=Schizopora paradoxa TaxID=27342 RepID=A0A0H2S9Z3_9AGAM|nr:hypothetical protein SCHPADRAFT_348676 [Schizopora paradoxa]
MCQTASEVPALTRGKYALYLRRCRLPRNASTSTICVTTMPPSWLLDAVESNEQESRITSSSITTSSTNTASPISPISSSQSQGAREPQTQARRRSSNRDPEVRAGSSNPPVNHLERRRTTGRQSDSGTRERVENPFSSPTRHTSNNANTAENGTNPSRAFPSLSEFDPYFNSNNDKKYDEDASASESTGSSSRSLVSPPQREDVERRRDTGISARNANMDAGEYGYAQGSSSDWRDDGGRSSSDNQSRFRYLLQRQNDRRAPLERERETQVSDLFEQLLSSLSLNPSGSGQGYANNNTFVDDRYRAPAPFPFGSTRPNDDLTSPFQSSTVSSTPPPLAVLACEVCGTPTFQLCSGCQILGYCNREHQEKDWSRHAEECAAWGEYYAGLAAEADPFPDSPVYDDSSNPFSLTPEEIRQTPGSIFQVDAILLPFNSEYPRLVKATFEVFLDSKGAIAHFQNCFDDLLGIASPWVSDAQWDEDMDQLPSTRRTAGLYSPIDAGVGRFSLHCRPNGLRNMCYVAIAGSDVTRPSAVAKANVPIWGDIRYSDQHQHGNGNFLILKHPPKTCCPEVAGSLVEDATLSDLDDLVPYLQQRRHFMGLTGGVREKSLVCPPRI